MTNSACVNVLHLTDLHFRGSKEINQRVITDALRADIRSLVGTPLHPQILIFSGDLANDADERNVYSGVLDLLIELAHSLDLTEEHILLCPGNHDVSRNVTGPALAKVTAWQDQADSRDGANSLYTDAQFSTQVHRAFLPYSELASQLSGPGTYQDRLRVLLLLFP